MLNNKNNTWNILASIVNRGYIYVFTSLEIAFSKIFKNSILNQIFFIDCLCLLAIDKIYLIKKWGKNFHSMYTKIEKVWNQIPYHVFLLKILAILI